jgi:hypothetical protein
MEENRAQWPPGRICSPLPLLQSARIDKDKDVYLFLSIMYIMARYMVN